jgi:RHS repeat-associated protein
MTEEAISRSEAKGTLTYGLDPVGNRQSLASTVTGINQQSASYNVNDQALANTYDANGNTLGANGKSYAYDSMDRMTSFNGGSVTMVYDGDGNRVAKTAGGVTTQYLVDELNPTGLPQVMDEVVKSGIAQRTYLYGLRRISQTQVASGTTSYYGYDAHGDVRYLMDSTGAVTDTYDYDAFGNLVGSTGTTPNVYRYQGEAFDSETGLYYMRARYYDPTVGRFLNVDPMTDEGEHPYTYAGADPVTGHDPTGQQEVLEASFALAVILPSVPQIMGAAEHIRCIWSVTSSTLAAASFQLQSVGACLVGGVGGAGGSGGPPPSLHDPGATGPDKPCPKRTCQVDPRTFGTRNLAAMAAEREAIPITMDYDKPNPTTGISPAWEFGGWILQNKQGKFQFTKPLRGCEQDKTDVENMIRPFGTSRMASYHTHPGGKWDYGFSDWDADIYNRTGMTGYVGMTYNGAVLIYIPGVNQFMGYNAVTGTWIGNIKQ